MSLTSWIIQGCRLLSSCQSGLSPLWIIRGCRPWLILPHPFPHDVSHLLDHPRVSTLVCSLAFSFVVGHSCDERRTGPEYRHRGFECRLGLPMPLQRFACF